MTTFVSVLHVCILCASRGKSRLVFHDDDDENLPLVAGIRLGSE